MPSSAVCPPSSTGSGRTSPLSAWGMLLAAQLAMSSGALFGRLALAQQGATVVAACRMLLASLPLLMRCFISQRRWLGLRLELMLWAGGMTLAAQFLLWTGALRRLSVGTTTLLVCTTPLYNALFERFVLNKRLPLAFWGALAAAAAGIGLVVGGTPPSDVPVAGQGGVGIACGLGCSMASAGYLMLMRQVSQMPARHSGGDSLAWVARCFGWAALALSLLMLAEGGAPPPLADRRTWLGIGGMAWVTQGVGHTLQSVAVRYLPASTISFATLIEPLLATCAAALLFDESIGMSTLAGGVVLLGALAWAMRLSLASSRS